MITIFTPTYNRAYIIKNLYESLLMQTNKDFEWLIVDDGSTDTTKEVIQSFIDDNKIPVRYYYKTNGGKHTAINLGVNKAKGELFFIVDSDDTITPDACEKIQAAYNSMEENGRYAGICFRRDGSRVIKFSYPRFTANSLELAYKYRCIGDKAEVFLTRVLKNYPFPESKEYHFVPEALVFNRIANDGFCLLCIDYPIYRCVYLEDGLTKGFKNSLKNNSRGFGLYYRECLKYKIIPFYYKMFYLFRLVQTAFYQIRHRNDS